MINIRSWIDTQQGIFVFESGGWWVKRGGGRVRHEAAGGAGMAHRVQPMNRSRPFAGQALPRARDAVAKARSVRSVFAFFSFAFPFGGVEANFLVVFLEGREIFTGFREFAFFHTFTDIPVNEGTLGVHEVELVVEAGPRFGDGRRVGKHAHGALHLGEVTAWDDGWRLVVDADLWMGGSVATRGCGCWFRTACGGVATAGPGYTRCVQV